MAACACPVGCSASDRKLRGELSLTTPLVTGWIERWVRRPRAMRWSVPVFGMCLIWWSSSLAAGDEQPVVLGSLAHNCMHVVAYALLAASIWLAWSGCPATARQRLRSRAAWSLAACYGVVDELHQSFVPGRVCSIADVISDCAGAALAVALLRGALGLSSRWRRDVLCCALVAAVGVLSATYAAG